MASLLIDSATKTLLAIHDNPAAIVFAHESVLDTLLVHMFEKPNYDFAGSLDFLSSKSLPHWSWHRKGRALVETPVHVVSTELIEKSILVSRKAYFASGVMNHVSLVRLRTAKGVDQQDAVYAIKRREAIALKNADYQIEDASEYPFVLQYSELKNISIRQAADDIILKSEFFAHFLSNTEFIRMKYLNIIKNAQLTDNFDEIFADFMRVCYHNTMV